jgi:hypothetical protein
MNSIKIITAKGTKITLTLSVGIKATIEIPGKDSDTWNGIKFDGSNLIISSRITAPVPAEYLAAVKELFAEKARQDKAREAEYLASDEHWHDKFSAKFYSRNSDY